MTEACRSPRTLEWKRDLVPQEVMSPPLIHPHIPRPGALPHPPSRCIAHSPGLISCTQTNRLTHECVSQTADAHTVLIPGWGGDRSVGRMVIHPAASQQSPSIILCMCMEACTRPNRPWVTCMVQQSSRHGIVQCPSEGRFCATLASGCDASPPDPSFPLSPCRP